MLELFLSMIGAIMVNIICHYIIKWLDSSKDDN